MKSRFQVVFKAMKELEKGTISNPDEGWMDGHYWLRNSKPASNKFLQQQIENRLDAICKFAGEIISGKVRLSNFGDSGLKASNGLNAMTIARS
ncbi:hypothetical protein SLA2020_506050 [Shorea laevis]